jgi:hypothetical protein
MSDVSTQASNSQASLSVGDISLRHLMRIDRRHTRLGVTRACPPDAGGINVPAPSSAGGMGQPPRGPGYKKAKRPPGEARLPRGPDRCGRTPTVANWTWASSPARIMRPPPHLPGNRRGGRSLPQAPQSCQEPVGSSGHSDERTGCFGGSATRTARGLRGIRGRQGVRDLQQRGLRSKSAGGFGSGFWC